MENNDQSPAKGRRGVAATPLEVGQAESFALRTQVKAIVEDWGRGKVYSGWASHAMHMMAKNALRRDLEAFCSCYMQHSGKPPHRALLRRACVAVFGFRHSRVPRRADAMQRFGGTSITLKNLPAFLSLLGDQETHKLYQGEGIDGNDA